MKLFELVVTAVSVLVGAGISVINIPVGSFKEAVLDAFFSVK
jgi:hypothetical protein